jgi:hypothetical protein
VAPEERNGANCSAVQGFVRDQRLDLGLEIRPPLLQNLAGVGISGFD